MPKVVVECAHCGERLERWPAYIRKSKTGNQYCNMKCFADSEASGLAERNRVKTHCPQNHEYTPDNLLPGRGRRCKKCHAAYKRRKRLEKRGLDEKTFDAKLKRQKGKCAICKQKITRATAKIDHCHASDETRDLLCNLCNVGLGHFEDDIAVLASAIEYLERWSNK